MANRPMPSDEFFMIDLINLLPLAVQQ
jgi:hypothetical protein